MFSNQQNELDFDDDDEIPEKDDFFEKQNAYEFSMRLPAKAHIYKIEQSIKDVEKDLVISSNDLDVITGEIKVNQIKNKEFLEKFSRDFYPEIAKLSKEVRRIIAIENNDLEVLKKQAHQLAQERIKLQNDTLVLENKVVETDKDLGFKYQVDAKKN